MENEILSVSEFNALLNQTLSFAYPAVVIEGEVANFKINQNKWIFFDLKDQDATVACFMTKYQLNTALEDGMLIRVVALPNLTKWGKFSLTVKSVELSGEGAVKRAFELLQAQFEKEGLFDPARKRTLPTYPRRIGLVTSAQAAAYNDFVTVVSQRWSGLEIDQAQVQVQGVEAPAQIVRAINYFNQYAEQYDVLVIIRGGGSAEDLQAFNDEAVVRAVFASKIPSLVGIGHEDDVSLAELAGDVRAATPTDAARRVVPDKVDMLARLDRLDNANYQTVLGLLKNAQATIATVNHTFLQYYHSLTTVLSQIETRLNQSLNQKLMQAQTRFTNQIAMLRALDPRAVLARGYAIASIDGKVIRDPAVVQPDQTIVLQLQKGSLAVRKLTATTLPAKQASSPKPKLKQVKLVSEDSDDEQIKLTI